MWDALKVTPAGRLSARNLLLFVTTILVTAFTWILISAPITHAADGEWVSGAIIHNGNRYAKGAAITQDDGSGLPVGSQVYIYIEPAQTGGSSSLQKAHIIYFTPGVDPPTAASANYATYTYNLSARPAIYSNGSGGTTITLTTQSQSPNPGNSACVLDGVGWIICPITNFLAEAMDWMFDVLSGFLEVRPISTSQDNALYRAWSVMRNFANVAFVISFLVIIYSQITGAGLSNYGIKKMLPRLILAAVLVNVSYWVCAVAIDASNILGYSIQDIFVAIRENLVGSEGNNWDIGGWKSMATFVLSGGTATAVAGIGIYALLAGTAGGAAFLLIPILVTVLMAVLVALLVLAARQAIITVLVIVSPLAFVAFLLPNTDKLFDKWRGLFTTMLVMFPIFSAIFGGSQLAGTAIIQNADSINLVILGMAVQVAPLVVTPLLVRFSGSLLGRIAGMVNNPNKGIIDRSRKWAQERADQNKTKVLASNRTDGLARAAKRIDSSRRKRQGMHKARESMADAKWEGTDGAHAIHSALQEAGLVKEIGENAGQAHFERLKSTNSQIQQLDLDARANKLSVDVSKAKVDANWEEVRAGDIRSIVTPSGLSNDGLANFVHTRRQMANSILGNVLESDIEANRMRGAKEAQHQHFQKELLADPLIQQQAGGIVNHGALKVQARATAEIYKEKAEVVKHIIEASSVKTGDIDGLAAEFTKAVNTNNAEAMRAYTDMLASSGNPGVKELRTVLQANEARISPDAMTELKAHINASASINAAAEDLASWSRDIANRSVAQVSQDQATWKNMAPAAFANMKQSSQEIAISTGGISKETAQVILANPAAGSLKPAIRGKIEAIAQS